MSLEERSEDRRRRMVAHRANSFAEADRWDLDYWQSKTPEERLSALVAIRRDVELVEAGREAGADAERGGGTKLASQPQGSSGTRRWATAKPAA